MKKYLLTSIILSSFAFSTDVELYTSAVIKLIKENKKITKQLRDMEHRVYTMEQSLKTPNKKISVSKNKKINFEDKTEEEIKDSEVIESFINDNI